MTDLRLIHYFEVVYRLLSFSKAAEELHLTHSAVTRSIKTLEEAWGVQLFYRTTRSVAPTEAGKRLYPMAVELLAFSDVVKKETVSGARQLRLISSPIAMDFLMPNAILEWSQRSPDIKVAADIMLPPAAMEELVQHRVNMVLFHTNTLASMPHADRIWFKQIMVEDFVMLFRPGHEVENTDVSFETLLRFPWVFPGYDTYVNERASEELRKALQKADMPRYNLYSPAACINLSLASDMLTILPLSLAVSYIESGHLRGKRVPGVPQYNVGVAMLKEARQDPNATGFVDCLDAAARKIERMTARKGLLLE